MRCQFGVCAPKTKTTSTTTREREKNQTMNDAIRLLLLFGFCCCCCYYAFGRWGQHHRPPCNWTVSAWVNGIFSLQRQFNCFWSAKCTDLCIPVKWTRSLTSCELKTSIFIFCVSVLCWYLQDLKLTAIRRCERIFSIMNNNNNTRNKKERVINRWIMIFWRFWNADY